MKSANNIERIVKMTFRTDAIDEFLDCNGLKLIRSVDKDNILFTYSKWNTPEDLENYRNSELFKETWSYVKQLFEARAEAWSTEIVAEL